VRHIRAESITRTLPLNADPKKQGGATSRAFREVDHPRRRQNQILLLRGWRSLIMPGYHPDEAVDVPVHVAKHAKIARDLQTRPT
jgi:hypothetical protein